MALQARHLRETIVSKLSCSTSMPPGLPMASFVIFSGCFSVVASCKGVSLKEAYLGKHFNVKRDGVLGDIVVKL